MTEVNNNLSYYQKNKIAILQRSKKYYENNEKKKRICKK